MAFPWIQHDNFEDGTQGSFTVVAEAIADPLGKLDFPGPQDDLNITPYRGGYVMRVNLDRGVTDAYVQHDTAFDLSPGQSKYMRFYLYLSADFKIAPGSTVQILTVFAGATLEFAVALTYVLDEQNYQVGFIIPDDLNQFLYGLSVFRDQWLCIQVVATNQPTTGSCWLHHNNNTIQSNRMTFGAFTHYRMGAMTQSADIRGTLYFDDVVVDDEKLHQPAYQDPTNLSNESLLFTKTSYIFVGPGELKSATLIGGAAGNSALFYDTDRRPYSHHNLRASLKVSSAESREMIHGPIVFEKGCFVELTGAGGTAATDPQLVVMLGRVGQQAVIPHMVPELVAAE